MPEDTLHCTVKVEHLEEVQALVKAARAVIAKAQRKTFGSYAIDDASLGALFKAIEPFKDLVDDVVVPTEEGVN